jgi:Uma2 family endonuclease
MDDMGGTPATASPLLRRYTLDEFFTLELPPGHGHYELIAGVLYVVPPPTSRHDLVQSRLNMLFAAYAAAHPNACVLLVPRSAVWTSAATYLEPDLFLVSPERLREIGEGPRTTADLVVEISSPSSAVYDRTAKADTYAALGVRELWLVDLEQKAVEQRVLGAGSWREAKVHAGSTRLESAVFPGLIAVPDEVFAPVAPACPP